jgi:DNA gyrase/topoisomerase IV subunit B
MVEMFEAIAHNFIEHFEKSYAAYVTRNSAKASSNMTLMLNYPEKYSACSSSDSSRKELFLLEGDSAKSDQNRDNRYQASYTLSGVPLNACTTESGIKAARMRLMKNPIYSDIMTILGLEPGETDVSKCKFFRVLITTDADVYGFHIAAVVFVNLYILCPMLADEGILQVVMPPLYKVSIPKRKPSFVNTTQELFKKLAEDVYCNKYVVARADGDRIKNPVLTMTSIMLIGEELESLSLTFGIEPMVLEILCMFAKELSAKTITPKVLKKIQSKLDRKIRYMKQVGVLVVHTEDDDIVVPLKLFNATVSLKLQHLYDQLGYSGSLYTLVDNETGECAEMTVYEIYAKMKSLNKSITVKRYKGLGRMSPKDRHATCIDHATRSVMQLEGVGDKRDVFSVMGNDASVRKELVKEE